MPLENIVNRKVLQNEWGDKDVLIDSEQHNLFGERLALKKQFCYALQFSKPRLLYVNKGIVHVVRSWTEGIMKPGDALLLDSEKSYVLSAVNDAEVIELSTHDKNLSYNTSRLTAEEFKRQMESRPMPLYNMRRGIHPKEWGHEEWLVNSEPLSLCGKLLVVQEQYHCSMHHHKLKTELFYLNKGCVLMEYDGNIGVMKKGDTLLITPEKKHRFTAVDGDAEIIEISTFHKDSDSHRESPSGKWSDEEFNSKIIQSGYGLSTVF